MRPQNNICVAGRLHVGLPGEAPLGGIKAGAMRRGAKNSDQHNDQHSDQHSDMYFTLYSVVVTVRRLRSKTLVTMCVTVWVTVRVTVWVTVRVTVQVTMQVIMHVTIQDTMQVVRAPGTYGGLPRVCSRHENRVFTDIDIIRRMRSKQIGLTSDVRET